MSVEFTRKAYLEVWRGTRYISRHNGLLEAGESASRDADEYGSGDYHITIGGPPVAFTEMGPDGLPHNHAAGQVFYMARADVTIRFSGVSSVNAFPVGAEVKAQASAVSAFQTGNDLSVIITGAQVTGQAGTLYAQPTISTIPDIIVFVGNTYDLWQYVSTPLGTAVSSQVLNLDTNIATWSHATGLLTGVAEGTLSGLQLEVTY